MRPQGFANSKLTKTMEKTDIGLIGLAVMGENLALNMESKGFSVSVYNRTAPGEKGVVDRFVARKRISTLSATFPTGTRNVTFSMWAKWLRLLLSATTGSITN